jgi:DNA-binding beta-propeller fold protein YncE
MLSKSNITGFLNNLFLTLLFLPFFNYASPALGIETPVVSGGPTVVGIISRPGLKPNAVAVYNNGNKVFVADDTTGNVYMYDGTTLAELGSVYIGRGITTMVVDERSGKLYAASLFEDKIGVLDAANGALIRYLARENADIFHRGYSNMFKGHLAIDEDLGKLYALSWQGLTQIDIATDSETLIHDDVIGGEPGFAGGGGYEGLGVNPVTHEVFVIRYIQDVLGIVDGITLQETLIPGLHGAGQYVGVNWRNDKVYIGYCGFHIDGRSAMCIYDRTANSVVVAEAPNDALNLFYNSGSNRIYSSVEIDRVATIIDGATDASVNLPMSGPRLAVGFRYSTGHVYYVGRQDIYVLRESSDLLPQLITVIPVDNCHIPDDHKAADGTIRGWI